MRYYKVIQAIMDMIAKALISGWEELDSTEFVLYITIHYRCNWVVRSIKLDIDLVQHCVHSLSVSNLVQSWAYLDCNSVNSCWS